MAAGLHGARAVRRQHGGTGHSVTREVADPNSLVVINEFSSLDGARAFAADPSLPEEMLRAGVDSQPQVWIVDETEARGY